MLFVKKINKSYHVRYFLVNYIIWLFCFKLRRRKNVFEIRLKSVHLFRLIFLFSIRLQRLCFSYHSMFSTVCRRKPSDFSPLMALSIRGTSVVYLISLWWCSIPQQWRYNNIVVLLHWITYEPAFMDNYYFPKTRGFCSPVDTIAYVIILYDYFETELCTTYSCFGRECFIIMRSKDNVW